MWSIYIARCADGTFYTGASNDVEARISAHNAGKGAKYTKARRPVVLAYREDYVTRGEALSREAQIKRYSRSEKMDLVTGRRQF